MKYIMENSNTKDLFYMRDKFIQKDITYIVGQNIYEYDMKEAGFNLIKEYNQLPDDEIDRLDRMTKDKRKIAIGLLMKHNKEFNKIHTKSFGLMRQRFIEANDIVKEDVLTIKKDAIFIVGRKCRVLSFGELKFSEKNKYTSFHMINGIEFYYRSSNDTLHVKGIDDKKLTNHEEGMLKFMRTVFKYLETKNTERLISFLKKFNHMYKDRLLPPDYYRELNEHGKFLVNPKTSEYSVYRVNYVDSENLKHMDISYNYMNYVLPIMQRYYFVNL